MVNRIDTGVNCNEELRDHCAGKRKLEEKKDDDLEPKYVKTGIELCWTTLIHNTNAVEEIASYLSLKDLQNLELAAKIHRNITSRGWEELQKKDLLEFKWADARNFTYSCKVKYDYCLGAALMKYIGEKECFIKSKVKLEENELSEWEEKIKSKYNFLIKSFPSFGCYIQMDLLTFLRRSPDEFGKVLKAQRECIKEEAKKGIMGGDLLLEGLIQINEWIMSNIYIETDTDTVLANIANTLKKAIAKKATCASLLALAIIEMNPILDIDINNKWIGDLALTAAKTEEKDFRALERYLEKASRKEINHLYKSGNFELPILTKLAFLTASSDADSDVEKEKALLEKIKEQGGGDKALIHVGDLSFKKEEFKEAEFFYSRAFQSYGDQVPPKVLLINMAYLKGILNKFAEAENFYDRAFQFFGDELSAKTLANSGYVKVQLNKMSEAENLYDRAFQLFGDQLSAEILTQIAFLKCKLKKTKEAEFFCERAILTGGNNLPENLLKIVNWIKASISS